MRHWRKFFLAALAAGLALVFAAGGIHAISHGMGGTHTNSGRISAIDLRHDTVVVEVPIIGDQLMTVGGELVQAASLQKDGRPAELADFNVGDRVSVKWRSTDDGHDITGLIER